MDTHRRPDPTIPRSIDDENRLLSEKSEKKRIALAAILSACVPGLGQAFLRRFGSAGVFFFIAIAFALGFCLFRLPHSLYLLASITIGWMALNAIASLNALHQKTSLRAHASQLWILLLLPLSLYMAAVTVNLFFRSEGFKVFVIPSSAMENTLYPGDSFVVDLHAYRLLSPKYGDIVLFRRNGNTIYLKRVIATGGDTILGKENSIYLNGKELDETYVKHIGDAPQELMNFGPIIVPQGKVFVAGDNRDVSLDSRTADFGMIDKARIMGKEMYVIRSKRKKAIG